MMRMTLEDTLELLKDLVRIPSFSRREEKTAQLLFDFLSHRNCMVLRHFNNIYLRNQHFKPERPTIILNSHHDTVQPNKDWSKDPFNPIIVNNRLYGLGTNDAGASLVSLLSAFLHFYDREDMPYNMVFLASAEEEVSGRDGVASVLPLLDNIAFGIVGEPTALKMAVAEKGLMVIDCHARGKSGHAARDEGENAIYKALDDIERIRKFRFPRISEWLGEVKMTATMIHAGTQHNVVPDQCSFVLDIRSTDQYRNEEILEALKENLKSEFKARSVRLQSSSIERRHILVEVAGELGIPLTGSSTLSDQALMPFPTVKIGPGDSARSHAADEYILVDEIEAGISLYIQLLKALADRQPGD